MSNVTPSFTTLNQKASQSSETMTTLTNDKYPTSFNTAPVAFGDLAYRYGWGNSPGTANLAKKSRNKAPRQKSQSSATKTASWTEPPVRVGGPSYGELAYKYGTGRSPGTSSLAKKKAQKGEPSSSPTATSSSTGDFRFADLLKFAFGNKDKVEK